MLLPNRTQAAIEEQKIVSYLLNPSHPDNGGKAAFFRTCGFTITHWGELAAALMALARNTDVTEQVQSQWGDKFVIDGRLDGPLGTTPPVRTIWIVDAGGSAPRLATAYPRKD